MALSEAVSFSHLIFFLLLNGLEENFTQKIVLKIEMLRKSYLDSEIIKSKNPSGYFSNGV